MNNEFDHRKEEFLSLRKEIETHLSELSILEKNSLLAIAAVYSWLALKDNGDLDLFFKMVATAIPFFISIFAAFRAISINKHLGIIGSYIKRIESITRPGDDEYAGWEHFFERDGRGVQTTVRIYFWLFLATTTFIIFVFSFGRL